MRQLDPNRQKKLHHLKQPPQQETHADLGRARKVELVAKSRCEDKVVHV